MGEEFYCILKLVSGEELISLITIDETGDEAIIIAQSPLIMKIQYGAEGSSYIKVKSWMDSVSYTHLTLPTIYSV